MDSFRTLRPYLQAASTGFLLILVFPKPNLSFLAWVALVPLLWACAKETRAARRFLLGNVAGWVFFLGTCYWVFGVMRDYGNLAAPVAAGVLAAMVAGLALYWGLFATVLPAALGGGPLRTVLGVSAFWTAAEFARGHVFIGFPWLYLGYATTDHMLLAQLARFTGVYGLSLVVAAFNAFVFLVAREPSRARGMRLAACFFVLAAISLAGGFLGREPAAETAYLLQTAVPVSSALYSGDEDAWLRDMQSQTLVAYARNRSAPGLVVWAENPSPFYFHEQPAFEDYLARMARWTGSYVIANAVTFADPSRRQPMNSAVVLDPDGRFLGQYDKIELVPFGEHVPYSSLFFFAGKLTSEIGDFVPGRRFAVFPGPKESRVAVLICYEAGFPELSREFTRRGAGVLVNISNDGWFGDSAARRQHLLMVRMRAIENDRWVLRATNDGITSVVDPDGRVQTFPEGRRAVYQARYGLRNTRTFYTRTGDWAALAAVIVSIFLVIRSKLVA